jgi:uncharacterized protein (TIGR03085 family)
VTRYAKSERAALADTLEAVGPDAPTLCTGWAARDLAAHLLLRERYPVASAGIVVGALSGYAERTQQSIAKRDFADLLADLRNPPIWSPTSNPLMDEALNLQEMYIHHEDVRRAQPNWRPRAVDPGLSEALWSVIRRTARLSLRRFPAAVAVEAPGHDSVSAGAGGPEVRVSGKPEELAMFLSGRQAVADVTLSGPDELVERLRTAKLGV